MDLKQALNEVVKKELTLRPHFATVSSSATRCWIKKVAIFLKLPKK